VSLPQPLLTSFCPPQPLLLSFSRFSPPQPLLLPLNPCSYLGFAWPESNWMGGQKNKIDQLVSAISQGRFNLHDCWLCTSFAHVFSCTQLKIAVESPGTIFCLSTWGCSLHRHCVLTEINCNWGYCVLQHNYQHATEV
jgi:hypothetical protein